MDADFLKTKEKIIVWVLISILIASIFITYTLWTIQTQNSSLRKQISIYESGTSLLQKKLSLTLGENLSVKQSLQAEQQNNAYFEEKINTISSTVGVLEKLSKTDSELLKKYSKVYFLNENYIPPKLTDIDTKYVYEKSRTLQIHTDVYPHLKALLDEAEKNGITLQVISAYRSFGTQAALKSSYKVTYGIGTANKFSADQGYSEHQLGTTVDFTTPKVGASFVGFDKSDGYEWLLKNAYKFGFIISYPKQNTYYSFEPWHWRFVGLLLAARLHDDNTFFYSLDQRDIDGYLLNLFD